MVSISKKYSNLFKKNFHIGYETEFVLKGLENYAPNREIYNKFISLIKGIQKKIIIGSDSSIEFKNDFDWCIEVKTNPELPFKSVEVLLSIFELIDKHGYTNNSCGLHANFSPVSNEKYYYCNPFFIARNKLWNKIKKDFKRDRNSYCKSYNEKILSTLNDISPLKVLSGHYKTCALSDHYSVINFLHYNYPRRKNSHIELRAMGGENYHKKSDLILKHLNSSLEILEKGCNRKCKMF